mmetsp:Transcript_10551/g.7890  ORF Transcript_10551/g.7890 Transcript_10551/m.7890 type:complete len:80 (+) Transcript_10551:965-1204(+)
MPVQSGIVGGTPVLAAGQEVGVRWHTHPLLILEVCADSSEASTDEILGAASVAEHSVRGNDAVVACDLGRGGIVVREPN